VISQRDQLIYFQLRNVHEITCKSYSLSLRERVGERGFKLLKLFRAC